MKVNKECRQHLMLNNRKSYHPFLINTETVKQDHNFTDSWRRSKAKLAISVCNLLNLYLCETLLIRDASL